jgi:putative DNA primase/helicase
MAKGNGGLPAAVAAMMRVAELQRDALDRAISGAPPIEPAISDLGVASIEDVDDARLAFYPLTDLGNAERFRDRHRNALLYTSALGWFAWDGRRWSRQGAEESVAKAVFRTVRAIQREADAIRGTADDKVVETRKDGKEILLSEKIASWGRASESAQKIAAIVKLGAPKLSVDAAKLDADPWVLNVENGTLVFDRSGKEEDPVSFRRHDPGDLITKLAPVAYDPDAACPTYDRFLAEVQPEADVRRFLHQWGGYSLTGDTGEQKLAFLYGKGRNGKSTLVDAWGDVAGDYGETVPIETFVDQGRGRNAGAATPDLAILPGVRQLRTSEPERGAKLAEALIKLVTGGEPIQARHLNLPYFKFRPAFKLTMSGNYRPRIDGTDEGIWRRVILVPWKVTVTAPDKGLPARLKGELSGILNRLLDGLRDYLDAGLVQPDSVTAATQDYRDDSDPLGRFLDAAVVPAPGERVQSTRLHEVFAAWAKATGENVWSNKGLSRAMKERGFGLLRSHVSQWLDIRLTKSVSDFADGDATPHPSYGDFSE